MAALIMVAAAEKGVIFVTGNPGFHYNGRPLPAVCLVLAAFCVATGYVLYRAFIRDSVSA